MCTHILGIAKFISLPSRCIVPLLESGQPPDYPIADTDRNRRVIAENEVIEKRLNRSGIQNRRLLAHRIIGGGAGVEQHLKRVELARSDCAAPIAVTGAVRSTRPRIIESRADGSDLCLYRL